MRFGGNRAGRGWLCNGTPNYYSFATGVCVWGGGGFKFTLTRSRMGFGTRVAKSAWPRKGHPTHTPLVWCGKASTVADSFVGSSPLYVGHEHPYFTHRSSFLPLASHGASATASLLAFKMPGGLLGFVAV